MKEYSTEELAYAAVSGLRTCINERRNRKWHQPILIADLIDHYIHTELSESALWHSKATRIVYKEFLKKWIRPNWSSSNIRDVRTVAVEDWLRHLQRNDGEPLASSTKAKVRSLMSVLFNHAIRYEWLEQSKNPITLVRQSAERIKTPGGLYLNMGHNDFDYEHKYDTTNKTLSYTLNNSIQDRLIIDGLLWLGDKNKKAAH